jgi:hypothetical protein
MACREKEIKRICPDDRILDVLLTYNWDINPIITSDVKKVLQLIDRYNSDLFPITDKLYQMLFFLFLKGHDPYVRLNRVDLLKLCVDVGFVNVCHYNDYYLLRTGAKIIHNLPSQRRNYKQCLYYYFQRVMITF